eukprot:TRINITY_DN34077_c0_g1_i1.p1 TRINITY_DN34077_c0_g1~~TRINITY_DN34077_c0_g1_i1.p1  ORF type:complete len:802 (+),score=467.08 TRINITY_DN34077_c0_g1_i1:338-2407(+)
MLGVEAFAQFEHMHTGERRVRAVGELKGVPQEVREAIDFLDGANTPLHAYRTAAKKVSDGAQRQPLLLDGMVEFIGSDGERVMAANQNTTWVSAVVAGDEQITVQISVFCSDSKPNTDPPGQLCKSNPPMIESFNFFVSQNERTPALTSASSPDSLKCEGNVCELVISAGIRNFEATTVRVQPVFAPGSTIYTSAASLPVFAQPFVTPHFLRTLYGVPRSLDAGRTTTASTTKNRQAVAEFLNQYYSPTDLAVFLEQMGLDKDEAMGVQLVGPNDPKNPGGEATLDIETILGVASGIETWFWSTAGNNPDGNPNQEPFVKWLVAISETPNAPWVHSVSFGDKEENLERSYMDRMNTEFAKAGVRGLSIMIASGDYGVASNGNSSTVAARCMESHPEFPACSPYITSVGATQLSTDSTPICAAQSRLRGGPVTCQPAEVVCSASRGGVITSGGGFSRLYARPSYQEAAVKKYIDTATMPPPHFYNMNGRAYPDVSAYGTFFLLVQDNKFVSLSGTSAATPTFSGIVSLLNDVRIAQGQQPLGFLNPWLYQVAASHPEAFNDIVNGDNKCTVNNEGCCAHGFHAQRHYDAVSGLGSPRFPVLARLAAQGLDAPYPEYESMTPREIRRAREALAEAEEAHDNASKAYTIGVTGLVFALIGVVVIAFLLLRVRRVLSQNDYQPAQGSHQLLAA